MQRLFEKKIGTQVYPETIKDSKFYEDNLNRIYQNGDVIGYKAFKTYAEVADIILQANYFNFDNKAIHTIYLGKKNKSVKTQSGLNEISTYTMTSVLDKLCESSDPKDKQLLKGGLQMMCKFIEYKKQEDPAKYEMIVPTFTDYSGVKVEGTTSINKLDYAKEILMQKYLPYTGITRVLEKVLTPEPDNGMSK